MKVFVATRDGQGARESDFCDAEEGEVLYWSMECDRDNEEIDGDCGCRRSLWGLETGGVTTTFAVIDLPLPAEWFAERVVEVMSSKGWFERDDEEADLYRADANMMLELAGEFTEGVIMEKRDEMMQFRVPARRTQVAAIARKRPLTKSQHTAKLTA